MPIHQTKYGGLKRRSNYEEELDYLLYHQEHMIYPDRAASQMLKSPYMTQFHSEHFNIMSEQDKKRNEKIEADARLKITAGGSGSGGLIPAMAAQGAPSRSSPPTYAMNDPNSPRGSAASNSGIVYGNYARTIREDVRDMRDDTIQQREQLDIPTFQQTPAHLQPSTIPPNMQIQDPRIQISMGAAVIFQEAASSSAMAEGFSPPVSKKRAYRDLDIYPFPNFGDTLTELKSIPKKTLLDIRSKRNTADPEIYLLAEEEVLRSTEWNDWITNDKPKEAFLSTSEKERKSIMYNKLIVFYFDQMYKVKHTK